jgi:hypothetical protein
MTPATSNQPTVNGKSGNPSENKRKDEAAPEQRLSKPGVHRAGDDEHHSIVNDLHDRDGERIRREGKRESLAEPRPARSSGTNVKR